MLATATRLLARIGRWPRRIAALACLLLAAASALTSHHSAPPSRAPQPAAHPRPVLRAGEVAVPVGVSGALGPVRPGGHVGVLATPPETSAERAILVADQLRVISVIRQGGTGTDPVVVVAADRDKALLLARFSTASLVLIIDELP